MKTFIFILTGFIIFTQFIFCQWIEQNSGVTIGLNTISAVDNNVCWAGGSNRTVIRTTNGGANWSNLYSSGDFQIRDIYAFNQNSAILCLSFTTGETQIHLTTNSGVNWIIVFGTVEPMWAMNFLNQDSGLAVSFSASRIIVRKTINGGYSWDSTGMTFATISSEGVSQGSLFMMGQRAWFYTNQHRVFYTSNFGANWTIQNLSPGNDSYTGNIWFNTPTLGMASCTIIPSLTTNGGVSWIPQTQPINGGFGTQIGGLIGYGTKFWCGYGTNINQTTDNGATWTVVYTAPAGKFLDISLARNGTAAWGVRENGYICKNANIVGISPISAEVPLSLKLYQNYPNPFNPETKIRFDISKNDMSKVKLAVYNILGKEISTLVNEPLSPGTYEVEWNGANYPSGIYFYKLETNSFSETKKLMLVK